MSNEIMIYSPQTGRSLPIKQYQGELTDALPFYVENGDRYQPIREDLADKILAIVSAYQQGQISYEHIQQAQNYAIEQSRAAHAESLAIVERMSDRALSSTESTIAHQQQTISTLANALATKQSAAPSNVSVKVETVERDRIIWIDMEWFAVLVLLVSVFGLTMWGAIATSNMNRLQPQSQSAIVGVGGRG